MRKLYVLYDGRCALCREFAEWGAQQPAFIPLEFVPKRSMRSKDLFPALHTDEDELVVVSDSGGVYKDDDAWIMAMYALEAYRELALRLAKPSARRLARGAFHWLSRNRHRVSWLLGLGHDDFNSCLSGEAVAC